MEHIIISYVASVSEDSIYCLLSSDQPSSLLYHFMLLFTWLGEEGLATPSRLYLSSRLTSSFIIAN